MSDQQDNYNHGGLLAFMFSMVIVFAFFFYIVVVHKGVDLQQKEVDPNAPVAAGEAKLAFDASKVVEPWVSTPEMVAHGQKVFQTNCAMCHGAEGKGDGAAGQGLNPKPRNLVEGNWKMGAGLIAKFNVTTNGIPGSSMAAFGHLKLADRWAMAHWIQSITQNKGSDDPAKVAEFAKTAK
jgi:mono/diheme cytochrome c family protein